MSFIDAPKRPRISISGTPRYPYDEYSQPELYRQMYQDNAGGDRSIHVSAVMGNSTTAQEADFDLLQVDTSSWPESYDGKTHKCIYNITQVVIATACNGPDQAAGTNGAAFDTDDLAKPYGLAIRRQGSNNASTYSCKDTSTGKNKTEYPQIVAAFPPFNSEFTVRQETSGASPFNYNQVCKNYAPGSLTFAGSYPAPPSLNFALISLNNDPNTFITLTNGAIIYLQFLITLLD